MPVTPITLLPYALLSLGLAKDALKLTDAGSGEDDAIEDAINQATDAIEGRCVRKLLSRDHIFTLDGTGGYEIQLPEWPATAVLDAGWLYMDGTDEFEDIDFTGWIASDYGLLSLPVGRFPRGRGNIRMAVTAGYTAAAHAQEIEALRGYCKRITRILFQEWQNKRGAIQSASYGGKSVTVKEKAIADILDEIPNKYRRIL